LSYRRDAKKELARQTQMHTDISRKEGREKQF
jgi:hypothetical protein